MSIFTKWICYDNLVGVTEDGCFYELASGSLMCREVHAGAMYYRKKSSSKRYSWKKCNATKRLAQIKIVEMPF